MRFHRTSLLTLALTALFVLVAGPSYATAQTNPDSAQITQLLKQAKSYATQAESDAAELDSYSGSSLQWHTHAQQLEKIRSHVNNLGKLHQQMIDMRHEGSPWQQEAIDRIDPLLRQMADQLTATIEHGNENVNRIHMMKYKNYARATHELATQTARLISDVVAYEKAKSRAEALEQQLELPASSTSASESD